MSTQLQEVLASIREQTSTVRDQGTSFEKLIIRYFQVEPFYRAHYGEILTFADWVGDYGESVGITRKTDTGIDLVAITKDGKYHAIQCKNYAPSYRIARGDIDSFFVASGRACYSHRIIVTTTDNWTENAREALENQQPPVSVIGRQNLENSVFDWAKYVESRETSLRACLRSSE